MANPYQHSLSSHGTGSTCYVSLSHHPTMQACCNRRCQSSKQLDNSASQLSSPPRNIVENHKESSGGSASQINIKEMSNMKETIPARKNVSTMTQSNINFPFYNSPFHTISSHPPCHLLCERGAFLQSPFVVNHPCQNYFNLPSIPNVLSHYNNKNLQQQRSQYSETNNIGRNNEQTETQSSIGRNVGEATELDSAPRIDTSIPSNQYPFQNTMKYPCYPTCFHSLVPIMIPSCCFDNYQNIFYSENIFPETQTNDQNIESQSSQNSQHINAYVNNSDISLTSVLCNNISTAEPVSPQRETNSSQLLSPHIETRDNEGGQIYVKGEEIDKAINYNCNKSSIPKISKLNAVSMTVSDNNLTTESHNTETVSLANQEIVGESKLTKGICKQLPVTNKLKSHLPQQIIKQKQEVCLKKSVDENCHGSKNEMKWTVYKSEMQSDSVDLNVMNIKNKIEECIENNTKKVTTAGDKFTLTNVNINSISSSNYLCDKTQHISRSKTNIMDLLNGRIIEEERQGSYVFTNEKHPQRDISPSPEIDLDRLALQLILNNQGSEDDELGDGGEEKECTDQLRNEESIQNVQGLNINKELQHSFRENLVSKIHDNKPKTVTKFSNNKESNINNQNPDTVNDLTCLHNDHLGKEECCKIWQNGESIENQQAENLTRYDNSSEYSDLEVHSEFSYNNSGSLIPLTISLDDPMSNTAKLIISFLAKQLAAKKSNNIGEDKQSNIWNSNFDDLLEHVTKQQLNISNTPSQDMNGTHIHDIWKIFQNVSRDHEQGKTSKSERVPEFKDSSSSLPSENHSSAQSYPQKKLQLKKLTLPTCQQIFHSKSPNNPYIA